MQDPIESFPVEQIESFPADPDVKSIEEEKKPEPIKLKEPETFLQGIGRRFLYGPNQEELGGAKLAGMSEGVLPKLEHPSDEGWPGYIARGLYNTLIQPLGSAEGLLGASAPKGVPGIERLNPVDRLRVGSEVGDLSNVAPRGTPQIKPRYKLTPEGPVRTDVDFVGPQQPRLNVPNENVPAAVPGAAPKIQTPQDKLLEALKPVPELNKQQREIYAAERALKLENMQNVETTGQAGAQERLSKLAGEHTKVQMEPLKLEQPDVDALFDQIINTPRSIGFNEVHAITGLTKALEGKVPQTNELEQLLKVFGPEVTRSIADRMPGENASSIISQSVNIPRKMMATMDMSAPFRQGLGLVTRGEFWKNIYPMMESFVSEGKYRDLIKGIESKPTFALQQDAKLALTDVSSLTNREEQMMATYIDKYVPGVKRSERAYSAFLNKLRSDTFDSLLKDSQSSGFITDVDKEFYKVRDIADFVNMATGRGSLGPKFERHAQLMNDVLFSPRLIASRLNYLDPRIYVQSNPVLRQEAIRSLFGIVGFGTTLGQMARLAGAQVSDDSSNADFGKIKIGDTRIDPFGGFQQYARLAGQLMQGGVTSSRTGNFTPFGQNAVSPTAFSQVENFAIQKTNPLLSFAIGMLKGTNAQGQPFEVGPEIAQRFIPLIIQDMVDILRDDPSLIPIALPAANFGMGVQTYK